jgi:hypothetical protein
MAMLRAEAFIAAQDALQLRGLYRMKQANEPLQRVFEADTVQDVLDGVDTILSYSTRACGCMQPVTRWPIGAAFRR